MLVSLVFGALLSASPCLVPPVVAPINDPFRDPGCAYCAGNRGIEYGPAMSTPVMAAADGTVSFAGSVAGTLYVVVDLNGGYRATYGRLASMSVHRGDHVQTAQTIASTTSRLFFGMRLGDEYVDPAPFLGTLTDRPYLVPLDGANRRPAPPAQLRCAQRWVAPADADAQTP